ncbi:MAG: hypothetical protein WC794_04410 [Candidatus Doudnabacteria bacterium]|jgi:phenylacetate-CoA ligase
MSHNNITLEPKTILSNYATKNEIFWKKIAESETLRVFNMMAKNVTAYHKFLILNKTNPNQVNSFLDFYKIPQIFKKNYFYKYPFSEISTKNSFPNSPAVMTSTSGSTGVPTYFARNEKIDFQYSIIAEYFLKNGKKGSSLLIDCFGMGVWIGGLITYQAFRNVALRGYPVSILTPGINKKEIFHCLKNLAPNFDNIILAGYPPFIKDIIDESKKEGISLKQFNIRLIFAAESFTENFREYVSKNCGIKDAFRDTLNIYGSAELGAMAHETPTSIFIRKIAISHPEVYSSLFKKSRIPTLAQYNPMFINFTTENNEILITSDNIVPFCKYKIGDLGGTYYLSEIIVAFSKYGIDLKHEAKNAGIKLENMPFVYIYERSDFSTTLYGLQIYPQTIKLAIEDSKLEKYLSGKFTLETFFDKQNNQSLKINLELKSQKYPSHKLYLLTEKLILKKLLETNSEFKELTSMISFKRIKPKLVFWNFNDPNYFKSGIKQQWIKN